MLGQTCDSKWRMLGTQDWRESVVCGKKHKYEDREDEEGMEAKNI